MHHLLNGLRDVSDEHSAFTASSFRAFCDALSFDQEISLARTIETVFTELGFDPATGCRLSSRGPPVRTS